MRRLTLLILAISLVVWLQEPVRGQEKKPAEGLPAIKVVPAAPSFKHLDGQMLVVVVNGVGGSTVVSDNLSDLNSEKGLHLRIQTIPWTRHNSLFADLTDHQAQLNAAGRIACAVTAIRKDAPRATIYLVGHSAGARVVLAAAEMSPAKSVDRIFVLAPAVSCSYDLTGALKASRYGIDNFYSADDGILEAAVEHGTTADGLKTHAAGRVGFRLMSSDKKDIEAYRAVRQYKWTQDFAGGGGHYAWTLRHNLKKTLVPMFFSAPAGDCVVEPKRK